MEIEWWYHISESTSVLFFSIDFDDQLSTESLGLLCNFGKNITLQIN